ncbi:MAG: response regulator [Synergistaceae bacterium]|nr:response regulator [Synergistaceae bacterium]
MTEKYWIIVVDDDVANLMMAGSIMSKNGMRVTALKSGKALIDYIEANDTTPDLCLLDIRMPDMDGFQALEALRKTKRGKNLPVVFLTAVDSERSEAKGLSLGAMDFIKKPFVPEILVLRVRHIIDLVRLQKNLAHVRDEIEKGRGTKFDSEFVDIILKMLDECIMKD